MGYIGQDYLEGAFEPSDLDIADGATLVVDLGLFTTFIGWFTGSATMTPCTSAGVALIGATAIPLTSGVVTERVSRYGKFAPTGSAMVVCRI